jgi:hypothetical protein
VTQNGPDSIIPNPKIVNVYWGSWFQRTARCGSPTCPGPSVRASHEAEWKDLANSAQVWSLLAEYGVGQDSYGGGYNGYPTIDMTKVLSSATLQNQLQSDIGAGNLPAPGIDTLYVIYLPNTMTEQGLAANKFGGRHAWFPMNFGAFGTVNVFFAVIAGQGGNTTGTNNTAAHEILEASTDAVNGQGWNVTGVSQGEIADLCGGSPLGAIDGYAVPSIWSRNACSCVN